MSNMFPGDVDAAAQGPHVEHHRCESFCAVLTALPFRTEDLFSL